MISTSDRVAETNGRREKKVGEPEIPYDAFIATVKSTRRTKKEEKKSDLRRVQFILEEGKKTNCISYVNLAEFIASNEWPRERARAQNRWKECDDDNDEKKMRHRECTRMPHENQNEKQQQCCPKKKQQHMNRINE